MQEVRENWEMENKHLMTAASLLVISEIRWLFEEI